MTERKCAIACNAIYERVKRGEIDRRQAIRELDKLEAYMSTAQIIKYGDFLGAP